MAEFLKGHRCWFCHWGWPKPIWDVFQNAVDKLDGLRGPLLYGPAHIVWEDENFDSAQWCLDNFEKNRSDYSDEELAIVKESLEKLLAVPDEYKTAPEGYDGIDPKKFPPPSDWEMVL